MARVKRYWIRYNKGADRLEQQITIGVLRPNGPGWIEIDVDNCCAVPTNITQPIPYDSTEVCEDITEDSVFIITLEGQDGQGIFSYNITPDTTSEFDIPTTLFGNFQARVTVLTSADYVRLSLYDNNDVLLVPAVDTDGSGTSPYSATFDISNLDHVGFTCQSSG